MLYYLRVVHLPAMSADIRCRWLIPIIGHMGIASSVGIIYDFAGPYTVTEDSMAFGRPTK